MKIIFQTSSFQIDQHSRNISLYERELCGIGGVDGAGKSLFLKSIAGITRKRIRRGEVQLENKNIGSWSYSRRKKHGVYYFGSRVSWLLEESLEKNLWLAHTKPSKQKKRNIEANLSQILGISVSLSTPIKLWPENSRKLILLAYLSMNPPKVLLIDEATSRFTRAELEAFHKVLDLCKEKGTSILYALPPYLTHLPRFDRVYWMDSRLIEERVFDAEESTKSIRVKLGQLSPDERLRFPPKRKSLNSKGIHLHLSGFSTEIGPSEIIGVFDTFQKPGIEIFKEVSKQTTSSFFMSGYRRSRAHFPDLSMAENISLPFVISSNQFLVSKQIQQLWSHYSQLLRLRGTRLEISQNKLDQQKILLARFLPLRPQLLFLDEITRGLDVESRLDLYRLFREISDAGVSLIWKSREIEELAEFCDRVVVLGSKQHKIIESKELTPTKLIETVQFQAEEKSE